MWLYLANSKMLLHKQNLLKYYNMDSCISLAGNLSIDFGWDADLKALKKPTLK